MRACRVLLVLSVAAAGGWVAVRCDSGVGLEGGCNPPCPPGEICVAGACVEPADAGDGDDGGSDAESAPPDVPLDDTAGDDWYEPPPDVRPDVPPDLPDDGPILVRDDVAGPDEAARPDDVGREEAIPADDGVVVVPRNTGEPCATDGDCTGPGAVCLQWVVIAYYGELYFANGYCSSDCGPGGECGPDGFCVDTRPLGGPVQCMKRCDTDAECRSEEGYVCTNFMIFPSTFCAPM